MDKLGRARRDKYAVDFWGGAMVENDKSEKVD